jgi:hypothetical protein
MYEGHGLSSFNEVLTSALALGFPSPFGFPSALPFGSPASCVSKTICVVVEFVEKCYKFGLKLQQKTKPT